ncbi:MAG: DNA double-strand break repair nuclease NurA [Candidatus Caldarchaeum sp.]
MLENLFRKAVELGVRHHEELVGSEAEKFFHKAAMSWISYSPHEGMGSTAAVDSGWNYILYHGFFLYGVKAVAVDAGGGDVVTPVDELEIVSRTEGVLPQLYVESVAESSEHRLAATAAEEVDILLVDGSLLARSAKALRLKGLRTYDDYLAELRPVLNRKVFFVSKYSQDNSLFDGVLGDIYYVNRATMDIGYAGPFSRQLQAGGGSVWVFYARLSNNAPALHVECTQQISTREIESFIDILHQKAVRGYPVELIAAHNNAVFSDQLITLLAETAGLGTFEESREVLSVG